MTRAELKTIADIKGQYDAEYPTVNALRIRRREKGGAGNGER